MSPTRSRTGTTRTGVEPTRLTHFITVPWRKRSCVKRFTPCDPGKGCGVKCGRDRSCKSFMAFESSAIISHVCPSTSSNSRSTVNYECSDNLQSMGDGRLEGASARLSLVWTNVMRRETLNAMAVKCSSLAAPSFLPFLLCEAFTTALLSTKAQRLPLSLRYHM